MKKINKTKLDLGKETIRVLERAQLGEAVGGLRNLSDVCNSGEPTCRSIAYCTNVSRQQVGC